MRRGLVRFLVVLVATFALSGVSVGGAAVPQATTVSAVRLRMPFTGYWDRWNVADPSYHCGRTYGCLTSYDWATDVYAAPGTSVKALVTIVSGTAVKLTIASRTPLVCKNRYGVNVSAGTSVKVKVTSNSRFLGVFSYGHLRNVPAFSVGQTISNGTVLGQTYRWSNSACWQVSSNSGVHTHLAVVSAKPGKYACYRALAGGANLYNTSVWTGKIGTTNATAKQRRCT